MKKWYDFLPWLIVLIGLFVLLCPSENEKPIPQEEPLIDSVAIIEQTIDSLEQSYALIISNLEAEKRTTLINQRKFYESKINHAISLPADSTINLFTTYTSRERRHGCSDSD